MAAAPPGLHMQPVRRDMLCVEAAYSMKELDIMSPDGDRKIRDTTEPVSDCSPMDLSRRLGTRERMRTTGAPDLS